MVFSLNVLKSLHLKKPENLTNVSQVFFTLSPVLLKKILQHYIIRKYDMAKGVKCFFVFL